MKNNNKKINKEKTTTRVVDVVFETSKFFKTLQAQILKGKTFLTSEKDNYKEYYNKLNFKIIDLDKDLKKQLKTIVIKIAKDNIKTNITTGEKTIKETKAFFIYKQDIETLSNILKQLKFDFNNDIKALKNAIKSSTPLLMTNLK